MKLTYQISKYSRKLNFKDVDHEIARAFNIWSEHTDLTFTKTKNDNPDFDIRFEVGYHGDNGPFDGLGKVLAHHIGPHNPFDDSTGKIHFDDSEDWTVDGEGTNLFQVAAHEVGHALGLHHSREPSALMFANYDEYKPNFRLHQDDIEVRFYSFAHYLVFTFVITIFFL